MGELVQFLNVKWIWQQSPFSYEGNHLWYRKERSCFVLELLTIYFISNLSDDIIFMCKKEVTMQDFFESYW